METFNSSFAAIDNMELATLLDLISVYEKITDAATGKKQKGQTYTVLD